MKHDYDLTDEEKGAKWRKFILSLTSEQRREIFTNGGTDREPDDKAVIPEDFLAYDERNIAIFEAVMNDAKYEEVLEVSKAHPYSVPKNDWAIADSVPEEIRKVAMNFIKEGVFDNISIKKNHRGNWVLECSNKPQSEEK